MPTKIDWTKVSPRGQAIARQIGTRLSEGYSPTEIGIEFGTSTKWVLTRIAELRRSSRQRKKFVKSRVGSAVARA